MNALRAASVTMEEARHLNESDANGCVADDALDALKDATNEMWNSIFHALACDANNEVAAVIREITKCVPREQFIKMHMKYIHSRFVV